MENITLCNEKSITNLVAIQDGKAVTSSLQVAQAFEKKHKNVIQAIENLLKEDGLKIQPMFSEANTTDSYGRPRKIYQMNRDGFSLLAMGFTGNEALRFKLSYIEAFNRMEECLLEMNRPSTLATQQWEELAKRVTAKYKIGSLDKKEESLSVLQILEQEELELSIDLSSFKKLINENTSSKSNEVSVFVEEKCFVNSAQKVPAIEVYRLYVHWCVERDSNPMSNRELYKVLQSLGFNKRRGSGNITYLVGMNIKNHQLTLLK